MTESEARWIGRDGMPLDGREPDGVVDGVPASVAMWALPAWRDVPMPERLDVLHMTVPERSYYGFHHGHGHTVYVSNGDVFESPLDAAAAWYGRRRRYWEALGAETDRFLAEAMPEIFG